jgi:hypothetical protein
MEWMHFWIGLGIFLNIFGIIAMWRSDMKDGWVTIFQDYNGDNIIAGAWTGMAVLGILFSLPIGLADAPQDTWYVILAMLGCTGVTAVAGFTIWGLVEFINAVIHTLNRAEQKTREVIDSTQARIKRNRERRAALRQSGKLRRNMKASNVRVRASGYHEENMEALPDDWYAAEHQLTALYQHIDVLLTGRARRGEDLTKAARDAKRHKGAEPGTPEHRAFLKATELCDFFKGRRRALGALIREVEVFLDGIEHEVAKYRPDINGEEIILGMIAEFCKEHGISLEETPEPEEDELLQQALREVDELSAQVERVTAPSRTSLPTSPDRKKQAGARKQRQGA